MATVKQRLYWKAPYFAKKWLASTYARKLDRYRHGQAYEQILSDISSRDNWSREQFESYQRLQLQSLINHVVEKVPYYRELFAKHGIKPHRIAGPEDLRELPILEKGMIRKQPESLLDENLNP